MATQLIRYEVGTTGPDEGVEGIGSDPKGSTGTFGLRIPATPSDPEDPATRYFFLLGMVRYQSHHRARIIGMRQYASMGQSVSAATDGNPNFKYIVEREIESPIWHPQDGNISWHLRFVPRGQRPMASALNADGRQFNYATTSSLIFEGLAPYKAPQEVWGYRPLGDMGTFRDLRFPYRSAQASHALRIPIPGPCDVAFFASVAQTDFANRPKLQLPGQLPPSGTMGLPQEDAFLLLFPQAIYWRIAGSIIIEEEINDQLPDSDPEVGRESTGIWIPEVWRAR